LTVQDQDLEDETIALVEAFIAPTSQLVDSTLKEVNFRQTFKANALAIRSHGRTIRERIGKIRLEYGDSLLILTSRDQLETLRQSPDFLVFEEVRHSSVRQDKIYYGAGIFVPLFCWFHSIS
jgi:di/tricarboxylate transporter